MRDMTNARESRNRIVVVGSINMDLVARCPYLPAPGETILGSDFTKAPGGKGANGAVAAARLCHPGNDVAILAAVGSDDNGATLLRILSENGVGTETIVTLDGVATGVALLAVADDGENNIIVVPGANGRVAGPEVERTLPNLHPSIVLMQLEVPVEAVLAGARAGHANGARVLLDPAPARDDVPASLWPLVDVLIPNEGELALLSGLPTGTPDDDVEAARALRRCGVGVVVVKRGGAGALIVDEAGARAIPAWPVEVVDTTGAGDCFDGALAVGLLEGQSLDGAVRLAAHAAALACTRLGAQSALPRRAELQSEFM